MLMALAILGIREPALGHDYQVLVGVTSNVLLTRGKVVLAQSDGSLTALDGDTGEVLARRAGDFSGRLAALEGVIVRRADWEVAVLDGDTFGLRWRAPAAEVWTLGSALVVRQRGSIAKLDLATGREVWRYPFEQPHSLVLAGERALVFRDRTERWNAERDDFDALGAAFAVLDLQTRRGVVACGLPTVGLAHSRSLLRRQPRLPRARNIRDPRRGPGGARHLGQRDRRRAQTSQRLAEPITALESSRTIPDRWPVVPRKRPSVPQRRALQGRVDRATAPPATCRRASDLVYR